MATTSTAPAGRLNAIQRGAFLGALIGWIFDYYEVFLMTMLAVPIAVEFKLTTAGWR
jgi:MFS transporter, putative metabolite:H+ symporter